MPNIQIPDANALPDLTTAVRQIRGQKASVGLYIPDAPQDNSLSQLGRALTRFNPVLQQFAVQATETYNAEEVAKAQNDFEKTRKDYAQLVEEGQMPPGASAAYIQAYKSKELQNKQLPFGNTLQAAYDASGLKDSDDPKAFEHFIGEQVRPFREASLMKDGQHLYTPLEIANSKFDEGVYGHIQSLTAQHIQYRTQERTKEGMEVATANAGLLIDKLYRADEPMSAAITAQALASSFFDPLTGVGRNGLTKTVINDLMVSALVQSSITTGDASVLDIAKLIPTYKNNTLADSGKNKIAFQEAREKISHLNDSQLRQQMFYSEAQSDGLTTPEGRLNFYNTKAQRREADEVAKEKDRVQKGITRTKEEKADDESTIVQQLLNDGMSAHSPYVVKHMDQVRRLKPELAMTLEHYAQSREDRQLKKSEDETTSREFTKLRADLYNNPGSFDAARIYDAGSARRITEGQVNTLYNEAKEAQKFVLEDKVWSSPTIHSLVQDGKKAVGGDMMSYGGLGAQKASDYEGEMLGILMAYRKTRPNADLSEVREYLSKESKIVAAKYNSTLADEIKKEKDATMHSEQAQRKTERETAFQKPQASDERSALDAQLKARYPNSKQRADIVEGLLKKGGK